MPLTEMERDVLLAIYNSDFQDGCRGIDTIGNAVWAEYEAGIFPKFVKGDHQYSAIVGSLVKKGYIDEVGEDCIALTQEGYNELFPRKEPEEL